MLTLLCWGTRGVEGSGARGVDADWNPSCTRIPAQRRGSGNAWSKQKWQGPSSALTSKIAPTRLVFEKLVRPTPIPGCIGITTQHYELMPELSADCLNAWVAYTHTPYCTTCVSTAVILRPTRIETSHPRFKSVRKLYYTISDMSVNEINTVKSAQDKSVKMPSTRKTNQQPA